MTRLLHPLLLVLVALLLLAAPVAAQLPEDAGMHPVGWRDVSFTDPVFSQGTVLARIYYPAFTSGQNAAPNPGAGPFPVVGFQHGWTQSASDFDNLCTHLASRGYLMASIDTETGILPSMEEMAKDTRSLMYWVELRSADASSWLFQMAQTSGEWTVVGNSLGATALTLIIDYEPRVRAIVPMAPPRFSAQGETNLNGFTGRVYFLTGTDDNLVASSDVHDWYVDAPIASRRFYQEVDGAGHGGPSDTPGGSGEAMPGAEQFRNARRVVTVALDAEVRGEENGFFYTLGEGGVGQPVSYEFEALAPIFWVVPSISLPNRLAVGLAGLANDKAAMAWSLTPASIPHPAGTLGLDLNDGEIFYRGRLGMLGFEERLLPGRAAWLGHTLYLQGYVKTPGVRQLLTRTVAIDVP